MDQSGTRKLLVQPIRSENHSTVRAVFLLAASSSRCHLSRGTSIRNCKLFLSSITTKPNDESNFQSSQLDKEEFRLQSECICSSSSNETRRCLSAVRAKMTLSRAKNICAREHQHYCSSTVSNFNCSFLQRRVLESTAFRPIKEDKT